MMLPFNGIQAASDCNANQLPDETDIAQGGSMDCNGNGVPDECELFYGSWIDLPGGASGVLAAVDLNGDGRADLVADGYT
ncbi:MAG: hypothetical protein ACREKK_10260, partial [Candidatus Methylomirabilales bacterium]